MTRARFTIIVLAAALVATVALVVSTGIGDKSDEERFRDAYEPVSEKLDRLQVQVHDALRLAVTKTDVQLSAQLSALADDLAEVRKEIKALDPPFEVEVQELAQAGTDVERSLRDIATAADENDPQAASTATRVVVQRSARLDEAQNRVAQAADE